MKETDRCISVLDGLVLFRTCNRIILITFRELQEKEESQVLMVQREIAAQTVFQEKMVSTDQG
jgi:hypothetical protein